MKTVVFDLDGTLADTSGDLIAAANACFEMMGSEVRLDAATDAGTALRGGRAMLTLGLSRMSDDPVDSLIVDAYYPKLLQAYAGAIDVHTIFYPGALDAVESLRSQGYRTAICTNKPEGLAETLMQNLKARDLFDALIGADTLPTRKPDPAPFFEAVARATGLDAHGMATSGNPLSSLLVGDTLTDHSTARAAQVPSVLVTFGPGAEDVAKLEPDALLHSFSDLPNIVAELLGKP